MRIDAQQLDVSRLTLNSQKQNLSSVEWVESDRVAFEDRMKKYSTNELVEKFNKALRDKDTHIQVKIHDKTNTIMVRIVQNNTDEVIREIPSEKLLDMMYNLCVQTGVFIDEKM